jgi:hypothetical protein
MRECRPQRSRERRRGRARARRCRYPCGVFGQATSLPRERPWPRLSPQETASIAPTLHAVRIGTPLELAHRRRGERAVVERQRRDTRLCADTGRARRPRRTTPRRLPCHAPTGWSAGAPHTESSTAVHNERPAPRGRWLPDPWHVAAWRWLDRQNWRAYPTDRKIQKRPGPLRSGRFCDGG